jgi:glycosyltransferase involved in cell wall biosynthesis
MVGSDKNERYPNMKIGYILTIFPCRSEIFARREIEELLRLGFDISIFAATGEKNAGESNTIAKIYYRPSFVSAESFSSLFYLLAKYPLAYFKLLWLILRLTISSPREAISLAGNIHTVAYFAKHLDRREISHVHAYFLSWPATIGLAISVVTGRPFSISAHARDIFVEHGAAELKISRAKFVTACTHQGLKHIKANLPAQYYDKLHLCHHGIKVNSESSEPHGKNAAESNHSDTIIAVGRMVPKKGFDNLLRAFASVIQKKPQYKLRIVGDGPERTRLNELIKQLSLENNVELTGWRESDETLRLIKKAAILVAPSVITNNGDRDGIANVILEAFANRTPVIASRLEGTSEAVEHRSTGLLVKPADVTELADAIDELLNNNALQSKLSKNAYETAKQNFDSVKNMKQLAKLFIDSN